MYVIRLASDYDGALAHDGAVDPATVEALERLLFSPRTAMTIWGWPWLIHWPPSRQACAR